MPFSAEVEGEYVVRDGHDVEVKFFTEKFILADTVKNLAQARCVIQAGLLTDRLRRNIPNFKRWRTCEVVSFKPTKEKPEYSELDDALVKATSLGCVPDNIDNYKDPKFKLKALQNAIERHNERMKKAKKTPDVMQEVEMDEDE